MKTCSKCGTPKTEKEYGLVHPARMDGKLRPDCKACVRKRTGVWYLANKKQHKARMKIVGERAIKAAKKYAREYLLTHPCVDCGETDILVLDFDHVRETKVCDVSKMVNRGYRIWRIEKEIAKCEVRCANDHRRATAKRRETSVKVARLASTQ